MNKKKSFRLIWFVIFGVLTTAGFAARSTMAQGIEPPDPPVIFLHYDYMAPRSWEPESGNFAPDPEAIDTVVAAFRRRGINLVIDPRHTEIPYTEKLFMSPFGGTLYFNGSPCPITLCVNFYDLKARYFQPHGNQQWHYAIFGDLGYNIFGGPDPVRVTGLAELDGSNFLVTFPHELRRHCLAHAPSDVCNDRVAAIFMHELGHNFGLRHGGDEEQNYKTNYMSVMNYQFAGGIPYMASGDDYQFGRWIGFGSPQQLSEAGHIVGRRLDYSSGDNPTLDENHLDEAIGIGGPVTSNDVTFYWSCDFPITQPCTNGLIRVAAGPFDWNYNGIIENDVAADINYSTLFTFDPVITVMRDFDDWGYIHQFLRTPRYVTGSLRPPAVE